MLQGYHALKCARGACNYTAYVVTTLAIDGCTRLPNPQIPAGPLTLKESLMILTCKVVNHNQHNAPLPNCTPTAGR